MISNQKCNLLARTYIHGQKANFGLLGNILQDFLIRPTKTNIDK